MRIYISLTVFLSVGLLFGLAGASETVESLVASITDAAASTGITDIGDAGRRRFLQDEVAEESNIETLARSSTGEDTGIGSILAMFQPQTYPEGISNYAAPYYKGAGKAGCSCSKEFMKQVRNYYRSAVNGLLLSLHVFCDGVSKGPIRRLEGGEAEGRVEQQDNRRAQKTSDPCPTTYYPVPEKIGSALDHFASLHEQAIHCLANMDCAGCVDKDNGYTHYNGDKKDEIKTYDCCCDADAVKDIVEGFSLSIIGAGNTLYPFSADVFDTTIYTLYKSAKKAIDEICEPYKYYPTRQYGN